MSHIPQRKEKDCLNCGTTVQGKYCHNCGQENVVPHETFWHMVKHFLYDITHFDSKFFDSMKFLLLKPGFLPLEYIRGRRASYLNPVKKYVFTSAIFFLLFFSFFLDDNSFKLSISKPLSPEDRANFIKKVESELQKDTASHKWKLALLALSDSSRLITYSDADSYFTDNKPLTIRGRSYNSVKDYDSVQRSLPKAQRDNWFKKAGVRKSLEIREKYRNNTTLAVNKIRDSFLQKLPYLLFVSLPFFALILKLLYFRHRDIFYIDHGIFTIYHYIFSFILLLVFFSLNKLNGYLQWDIIEIISAIIFLSGGFYLYKSMRNFYKQRRLKTITKFLLLNIAGLVMMVFLFAFFVLFSVFEI